MAKEKAMWRSEANRNICNNLLLYEYYRDQPFDIGIDAAYRYLLGERRYVDPLLKERSKGWFIGLLLAFVGGAIAAVFAFTM